MRILHAAATTLTVAAISFTMWFVAVGPADRATALLQEFPALAARPNPAALVPDPLFRNDSGESGPTAYDESLSVLLKAHYGLTRAEDRLVYRRTELAHREEELAALEQRRLKDALWWKSGEHEKEVRDATARRDSARRDVAEAEELVKAQTLKVRVAEADVQSARIAYEEAHGSSPRGSGSQERIVTVESRTLAVMFHDDTPPDKIREVLAQQRLETVSGVAQLSLFVVRLTDLLDDASPEAAAAGLHARIQRLLELPIVEAAAPNIPLHGTILPPPNPDTPRPWFTSDGDPLVNSHFPEAWNFNRAIRRSAPVDVAVLDERFLEQQQDLEIEQVPGCGTSTSAIPHGTLVAGIIGARWGDGHGIDGAASSVHLLGCSCQAPVFASVVQNLQNLVDRKPGLRIINASLGYNWNEEQIVPADSQIAQRVVINQGVMVRKFLREHQNIVVVSAAGNDCLGKKSPCDEPAKWTSAFNWALLGGDVDDSPAVPNVIVVEALDRTGANHFGPSNRHGTLAAIGQGVITTTGADEFAPCDGTSAAAPLVSATLAMMLAVNPDLTVADLERNLGVGDPDAGGSDHHLNAFDAVRQSDRTADADLADLNGDGHVNMLDFAMFKEAFRQAVIDKKATDDLNEDHAPVDPQNDLRFCRADLDGNGHVDADDLKVMIAGWDGPESEREKLPALLNQ